MGWTPLNIYCPNLIEPGVLRHLSMVHPININPITVAVKAININKIGSLDCSGVSYSEVNGP